MGRGVLLIGSLIATLVIGYLNTKQTDAITQNTTRLLPSEDGSTPRNAAEVPEHVEKVMQQKMQKRMKNLDDALSH